MGTGGGYDCVQEAMGGELKKIHLGREREREK